MNCWNETTIGGKKIMEIKPKEYGWEGIDTICSKCGEMFSERRGHKCKEEEYY
jgi:formylmethanofuran dehydrogenase subunit E